MRFRGSLAARVALLATVAVGLSVTFVAAAAYLTVKQQLYSSLDHSMRTRAQAAAASTSVTEMGDQKVPPWLVGATGVRIGILAQDGSIANDPFFNGGAVIGLTQSELAVAKGDETWSVRTAYTSDGAYRVGAVPGNQPGTALILAQKLRPTQDALDELGLVLALIGLAGVVAAGFAGWAVARQGLSPVRRLSDAVEEIARTEQLKPIAVEGDDEIARLATAFNRMLAALSASRDRQRQLVADAGHELRTPLTSLRTNLDLLTQADKRGGLSTQARAELMDDVRFQINELTTLIGDLTELAREEPVAPRLGPVDLADVVGRAADRVRRRATAVQFDVALEPWPLVGDETSLERAVTNLMDNAAKWSPPHGVVTVRLHEGTLYVGDQGPGISDADLPHVFERFYRSTESRTMPGSGLGLSIVHAVAERHGGAVRAGRSPDGGAAFWMRIPGDAVAAEPTLTAQEN